MEVVMRALMLMWVGVMLSGCLGDYPPPIEWVRIEGGSFMMGSDDGASNERPVHEVTVSSFEMTKTEVTVAQYEACVEAGVCSELDCSQDGDHYPVVCVSWGQARTFAKWLGEEVDLPTEAEWEYAVRGGEAYRYAGSDDLDEVAWYSSNSGGSRHPVGRKQANGYGLYDMSGNVWEWTLDEYHSSYSGAPSDGSAWGSVPVCRQMCDIGSARRIFRGGSWRNDADSLRVANRNGASSDDRYDDLGFRLRRTLP
jgi:formylglycine-generating enzyme required for sulfatase activity